VFVTTAIGGLLVSRPAEARQYRCESPSDGYCLAVDSTKLVSCVCNGETTEVDRDDLREADNQQMMDICWEVWSDVCSAWSEEPATCDEPGLGTCEVDGRDGGFASCACEDGRTIDHPAYDTVGGLAGDALLAECWSTLETSCAPVPPPLPPAAMSPVIEASPNASSGCSVGGRASGRGASWMLLFSIAWMRRRRRARSSN
jgi:hypothetical protein